MAHLAFMLPQWSVRVRLDDTRGTLPAAVSIISERNGWSRIRGLARAVLSRSQKTPAAFDPPVGIVDGAVFDGAMGNSVCDESVGFMIVHLFKGQVPVCNDSSPGDDDIFGWNLLIR